MLSMYIRLNLRRFKCPITWRGEGVEGRGGGPGKAEFLEKYFASV